LDSQDFVQLIPPHLSAALHTAAVIVGRDDAEDAVQEAIIRAWRAWANLREPEAVRAWFLRITVNVCQSWQRGHYGTERRMTTLLDITLQSLASDAHDPGTGAQADSLDLRFAIDQLDHALRQIVVLRYYADLDSAAIGEILGVAPGTVRARLRRALLLLHQQLSESPEQPTTKGASDVESVS
jgi:RNA polymerase sigma factor (sigma-70 family)